MRSRSNIPCILLLIFGLLPGLFLNGQDVPSRLLSIPVYHPMVINPAYAGSKDFTHVNLTTKATNFTQSQLINIHTRLATPEGEYSNFGVGAYAYQEQWQNSWSTGLAVTGSYHYSLDERNLHNLSAGVSLKGFLMVPKHGEEAPLDSSHSEFRPNVDLGLYYYGPKAFAGLSTTSLIATDFEGDSAQLFSEIEREYHLFGGYKFLLNKKLRIVLEPSLLISVNDETISEAHKHIVPYLKLYLQNFYLGTYLKDFDTFALFFQYQFPKFYTGLFIEFPRVGYLNDDNIIIELSMGLNLGQGGPSFLQYRHW